MISIKHRFDKDYFAKLGETPRKDWRLALICFAGGLLLVVAIDGLLFASLLKERRPETSGGSIVTLEKEELIETMKAVRKADAEAKALPASMRKDPAARPASSLPPSP